ncbi:hypothetical protein ORD22_13035 [Sporosarcina sp. GW1-11]|uniref:S-Ena type endospore appendage n=1 Tax=Sporosarcina sp. GW1-11 TaxID=2899126 RepID=UPI00294E97F4|nr:S-Ena type endospore appendage [Sporosarcina sp. GW1-11]MDV6379141.1 hypothetical protein [Sporosarcina sp. GW1-11]
MDRRRGEHHGQCNNLVSANDLIQLTMRTKLLRVASKMTNGDCFTTSYFIVKSIDRKIGSVVLQLIRPIFRNRLLFIRTSQVLLINLNCVCATQKLYYPILDWVELCSTTRHRMCGNVCMKWSLEQSVIYKNYTHTPSIAFYVFSYWKGEKEEIQLRITSRSGKVVLLTIPRGETRSIAVTDLVKVKIVRQSSPIIGSYTNSLHEVYTNRIEDPGCSHQKYFTERALISETLHVCSASGKVFQNHTNNLLTATVTIRNTSNKSITSRLNKTASIIIPPHTSRSVTVPSLQVIEIDHNDSAQPVEFNISFHAVV